MPKRWPEKLEQKLIKLVQTEKYTYGEIGELIGKPRCAVAIKAQALGLKNPVYMRRITKHKHLREKVFRYYMTHSREQCEKRFNLKAREVNSIISVCYLNPKLSKLRKDTRNHSAWTAGQIKFLIHRLGIRERVWIAKKLKRTKQNSYESVKEQLSRMRIKSKHFHGLASEQAALLFDLETVKKNSIKTKAGPNPPFRIRVMPWVTLERLAKKNQLDPFWCKAFAAQAKLQRWIYGVSSERAVRNKIKSFIRER